MKVSSAALKLLLTVPLAATAFVSNSPFRPSFSPYSNVNLIQSSKGVVSSSSASPLQMMGGGVDPFTSSVDSMQHALSSLLLSDAATDAFVKAADNVDAAADVADAASSSGGGWFGFLTQPIEVLLETIHSVLVGVGLDANAWGVSIILITVVIKIVTYPLTSSQLESTNKMQVLQPKVKEIQNTYQSNPEVMNQKISELYQTEQVNPLAGCLPSLVQLPVFIGLYRAVLALAKDNKLDEPFLWLPNLEGPVYGADPTHGSDWILKGWEGGTPTLGWGDTLAFLTLPVFLVISQFISQQLMQPKTQDPSQENANAVLKFLPLLIGWFSLNVPAALGIYWVANNVITTALTLQIRSGFETPGASSAGSSASVMESPSRSTFQPAARKKPSGFGASADSDDMGGVKPITPIDAEIVDADIVEEASSSETSPPPSPKKRGKKKKKKGKK